MVDKLTNRDTRILVCAKPHQTIDMHIDNGIRQGRMWVIIKAL